MGLGEREKAAKSAGRDERVRVLSSAAGAVPCRPRSAARVQPTDGSSCFDSYAGSGGSGVSAGADPSVLAAGSFHIRGSRIANYSTLSVSSLLLT